MGIRFVDEMGDQVYECRRNECWRNGISPYKNDTSYRIS